MLCIEVAPRHIEEHELAVCEFPHERRRKSCWVSEDDHEVWIVQCWREHRQLQRVLIDLRRFWQRPQGIDNSLAPICTRVDDDDHAAATDVPHSITAPRPEQAFDESSQEGLLVAGRDFPSIGTHGDPLRTHRANAVDHGVNPLRPTRRIRGTPFFEGPATHDDVRHRDSESVRSREFASRHSSSLARPLGSVADYMSALDPLPHGIHVACIMDGNGRWARRRGLPRTDGHTAGEENLAAVVRHAAKRNVGWLTVFGFSTENWIRPRAEVRHILSLHKKLFGRIEELNANNVRVRWIGRPFDEPEAKTPTVVQKAIRQAIDDTAHNTGMVLTVAFDYGSRAEIVRAVNRARHLTASPTSETVSQAMYLPQLPPVDLLVRTSGESRISNFLLWQIPRARIYFTERTWPDFDAEEFDAALTLLGPQSPA